MNDPVAFYTLWLAGATVALVLVAAFQAGMFVWQLGLMREGVDDAKTAADAAATAANASTEQTEIARRTMFETRRPFVFTKGIDTEFYVNNVVEFSLKWENSGITPAVECHTWVDRKNVLHGHQIPVFDKQTAMADESDIYIGPNGGDIGIRFLINFNDLIKVFHYEIDIYFWARIEYRNLLQHDTIHMAERCVRIIVRRDFRNELKEAGRIPTPFQYWPSGPQNEYT